MAINFKKGERQYHNVLYKKLRKTWYDMIQRCYNPNHTSYRFYGAKGVYVSDEWRTLDGFLETVDLVPGWDEQRYKSETMHLDKDLRVRDNRVYSVHTCSFVSPEDNLRPVQEAKMKECKAISPQGEIIYFKNKEAFCREHGLNACNVYECLTGKNYHHKRWRFEYVDGSTPKPSSPRGKIKIATSPEGKTYEFINTTEFASEHSLNSKHIGSVVSGNREHHKGWKFQIKGD